MDKIYNVRVRKGNDAKTLFSTTSMEVAEKYLEGIDAFYDYAGISSQSLGSVVPKYTAIKITNYNHIQTHELQYTVHDQGHNTFYRSSDNPNHCYAIVYLPFGNAKESLEEAYKLFELYKSIYTDETGYIYLYTDGSIQKAPEQR